MTDLKVFGTTYTNVTGIKATDSSDAIVTFESGGGTDYLELYLKKQLTSYSSNEVTGATPKYMFFESTSLQSLTLPNATTIETNGLKGTHITTIKAGDLPKVFYVGSSAFQQSYVQTVVMPIARSISQSAFAYCTGLKTVDIGATQAASIAAQAFNGATAFDTLILRGGYQYSLANANAFNNTPFASGGTGGTLYVPSSLVATYQSATNWSTILGYANNQILPIEGSIYETQYADGTAIE